MSDKNKTLIFKLEGCFIVDNGTFNIVKFSPSEIEKGLYKLGADSTTLDLEVNLLHHHCQTTFWHKKIEHFHTWGI